ncbi:MAG TPA: hypothetical protein DCY37_05055 [Acidaminococcaceae bacterium]|nr:hypothetical protein [Acidaminococcaceae bacterium]
MRQGRLKRAFTYLESGPVLLVTSRRDGRDDIMTISWHMVMDFIPHLAITTGPWNESYERILAAKECTFFADGELFNRRAAMQQWVPGGCERL